MQYHQYNYQRQLQLYSCNKCRYRNSRIQAKHYFVLHQRETDHTLIDFEAKWAKRLTQLDWQLELLELLICSEILMKMSRKSPDFNPGMDRALFYMYISL